MKYVRLFEDDERAAQLGNRVNWIIKEALKALYDQLDKDGIDYAVVCGDESYEYSLRDIHTLIAETSGMEAAMRILNRRRVKNNQPTFPTVP